MEKIFATDIGRLESGPIELSKQGVRGEEYEIYWSLFSSAWCDGARATMRGRGYHYGEPATQRPRSERQRVRGRGTREGGSVPAVAPTEWPYQWQPASLCFRSRPWLRPRSALVCVDAELIDCRRHLRWPSAKRRAVSARVTDYAPRRPQVNTGLGESIIVTRCCRSFLLPLRHWVRANSNLNNSCFLDST